MADIEAIISIKYPITTAIEQALQHRGGEHGNTDPNSKWIGGIHLWAELITLLATIADLDDNASGMAEGLTTTIRLDECRAYVDPHCFSMKPLNRTELY